MPKKIAEYTEYQQGEIIYYVRNDITFVDDTLMITLSRYGPFKTLEGKGLLFSNDSLI